MSALNANVRKRSDYNQTLRFHFRKLDQEEQIKSQSVEGGVMVMEAECVLTHSWKRQREDKRGRQQT